MLLTLLGSHQILVKQRKQVEAHLSRNTVEMPSGINHMTVNGRTMDTLKLRMEGLLERTIRLNTRTYLDNGQKPFNSRRQFKQQAMITATEKGIRKVVATEEKPFSFVR
jgi:hypothetical protein